MSLKQAPLPDALDRVRRALRDRREPYSQDVIRAVDAWLTLKRTSCAIQNVLEDAFRQVDLTGGRLNVLMALDVAAEHTMALSDIGEYLVVTRPNITGLIDGLVADGLVRRIHHAEDRRMVLAQLTERGIRFMRTFVPQHFGYVVKIMDCLDHGEKRNLIDLLDKVRAHVQAVPAPKYHAKR